MWALECPAHPFERVAVARCGSLLGRCQLCLIEARVGLANQRQAVERRSLTDDLVARISATAERSAA